jgi:hypothetical protein
MTRPATASAWRKAAIGTILLSALACNRQAQQQPGVESRPATTPSVVTPPPETAPTTRPPVTQPTQPAPATAPATRPQEELPPSTFDTKPPYTVKLYVRKPEDKQPGWLKILALDQPHEVARAAGVFPEKNVIDVTTENIHRIQLELGYLPLAESKRVVLHIDRQGIEITRRDRRFITLQRRPTGEWIVEPPPKEKE